MRAVWSWSCPPRLLVCEIIGTMEQTMARFGELGICTMPLLTVETDLEALQTLEALSADNGAVSRFLRARSNRRDTDYKVTAVCPDAIQAGDVPYMQVVEPFMAVHTIAGLDTDEDYSGYEKPLRFIRDHGYAICGSLYLQILSNCYCSDNSREYVEMWLPVKIDKQP